MATDEVQPERNKESFTALFYIFNVLETPWLGILINVTIGCRQPDGVTVFFKEKGAFD